MVSYLREREPFGCRRRIEARRTASPRRAIRIPSGLPAGVAGSSVLVGGRVTRGVPSTPSTSPLGSVVELVVEATLEVVVSWVLVVDSTLEVVVSWVLVVDATVEVVSWVLVVDSTLEVVVSSLVEVVCTLVEVVSSVVVVVVDSEQFSEFDFDG